MLSRRAMVGRLAAGTVAVCAAGTARVSLASTRSEKNPAGGMGAAKASADGPSTEAVPEIDSGPPATHSAPAPWELLSPLAAGSEVSAGWRVTELSGVTHGSCVVTLENAQGRVQRVHVCGNSGQPQGLVFTEHLDLVVMNGGRGDLPTDEGFAKAVAEVAHVLARNERRQPEVMAALLPHAERLNRFAGAQLR